MLKFKNVGTLDLKLTKLEISSGIYSVPCLTNSQRIEVLLPAPKQNISNISTYTRSIKLFNRMIKPLEQEIYYIVDIAKYDYRLWIDKYKYIRFTPDINESHNTYHLVKKRNYNKYLMQCLSGIEKIDYIIIKQCDEIDKALNLGFIEKL